MAETYSWGRAEPVRRERPHPAEPREFVAWASCPFCGTFDVHWFDVVDDLLTRTCRSDSRHTWMEF